MDDVVCYSQMLKGNAKFKLLKVKLYKKLQMLLAQPQSEANFCFIGGQK